MVTLGGKVRTQSENGANLVERVKAGERVNKGREGDKKILQNKPNTARGVRGKSHL